MNNNFQNPLQVLKAKSQEAWSGCIEIKESQDISVSWNVYLLQGKIQYINSTQGQQARLNYLWQKFKLGCSCPQLDPQQPSEYGQLCRSFSSQQFTDIDIKKLLFLFAREGLTHVLSIEQTQIKFIPGKRINKSVISFDLEQLEIKLQNNIKAWQQIRTYLSSPFSRLYLEQKNAPSFSKSWETLYTHPDFSALAKSQKLSAFVSLFVAQNNLYYIAYQSKVDTLFLATHLQQAIDKRLISLLSCQDLTTNKLESKNQLASNNAFTKKANPDFPQSQQTEHNSSHLVVCIDDSKLVQKQVKITLEARGYQVLSILDPSIALEKLSQQQPTVIFMDVNMPNVNGYSLCNSLRKSEKFKEVPIIMLTGRDSMIDRVR
ncbi:response regulator, partial [Pleurocapsales cyanobacterium LEGE 10410]|nr:response regulator [Pleurocapsales cyanobacterium LEGE 10410]